MIWCYARSISIARLWPSLRNGLLLWTMLAFTAHAWQNVMSLEHEWLVYHQASQKFLPYLPYKHQWQHVKYLPIHQSEFIHSYLHIQAQQTYHLFLNGQYLLKLKEGTTRVLSIDSLMAAHPGSPHYLAFYQSQMQGLPALVTLVQAQSQAQTQGPGLFSFLEKKGLNTLDGLGLGLILLALAWAWLYRSAPRTFYIYCRPSNLGFKVKDLVPIRDVLDFSNLSVLLLHAFTGSLMAWTILSMQGIEPNLEPLPFSLSGAGLWWTYFTIKFFLLCFLFLLRFFLYQLVGQLFNFQGLAQVHLYKVLQSNLWLMSLNLVVFWLCFSYWGPNALILDANYAYAIRIFFLLRLAYLWLSLRLNFPQFNALYLTAYLLTIEMPILIFGMHTMMFPEQGL